MLIATVPYLVQRSTGQARFGTGQKREELVKTGSTGQKRVALRRAGSARAVWSRPRASGAGHARTHRRVLSAAACSARGTAASGANTEQLRRASEVKDGSALIKNVKERSWGGGRVVKGGA